MNQNYLPGVSAALLVTVLLSPVAFAAEEDRAKDLCKAKIEDVYGVNKFRNTLTERLGNHKFQVDGEVRFDHHSYDFQCKIKQGNVKSYSYGGPDRRHNDDDDIGTAIAVGAGLAIIAAIAASSDDDKHSARQELPVAKTILEDDCHDMLQYRIRDEHDYTARVTLKEASLSGHDLTGDAKVKYDRGSPHHATYTCHFDGSGRLKDSSYHLY